MLAVKGKLLYVAQERKNTVGAKYYKSGNAFSIDESGNVNIRNKSAVIGFSYSEFGELIKDISDFYLTHYLVYTKGKQCFDCPMTTCDFNSKNAPQKIAETASTANNSQSAPCPVCGASWDMLRYNTCSCGAALKSE